MKEQLEKWLLDLGAVYQNDEGKLIPIKNIYTNDILEFIESLSVEPKAESVEGLIDWFIKNESLSYEEDKALLRFKDKLNTLPSVKPVMPEEMHGGIVDAIDRAARDYGFNPIRYRDFAYDVYQAIRTALINSGDKDKVNE